MFCIFFFFLLCIKGDWAQPHWIQFHWRNFFINETEMWIEKNSVNREKYCYENDKERLKKQARGK